VRLAPNEANPYDTRGYLYARTGKFDKAVADFKQALKNKPGFFESRKGMMSACILNRDFDSHNFACQLFLDSESRYCRAGARLTRGIAMEAQGKFAEAIETYQQGIGADILDDADESGFFYQKFIRRTKIAFWIYDDLAIVDRVLKEPAIIDNQNMNMQIKIIQYVMNEDYSSAREGLKGFIQYRLEEEDPDSSLYKFFEWMMAFRAGDYHRAIKAAEIEYELDSLYATRARLGITYFLNGQPEKAVEYLTIDTWENFEDYARRPILYAFSRYYLGRSYEESGWNNKAAEKYREFLDLWGNGEKGIKEVEDARERLAKLDQSA
jgi:tetratricopeptide (TPR) repeat protein